MKPGSRVWDRIRLSRGDITAWHGDAIVNAANTSLLGGGGVDGAIHRAAGPGLLAECRALGGCAPGDAKRTAGHALAVKWVIHTVGPVWRGGQAGEDAVLARCHQRSLELAEEVGAESIAFPAISTGAYGFPSDRAAAIALDTVAAYLASHAVPATVDFVLFTEGSLDAWRKALEARAGGGA